MADRNSPGPEVCEQFDRLMAQLDYPMFVVTVRGADGPSGCLVGFASQVSISPALFLVGLSKQNHTLGVSQQSTHLAVHVIPRAQGDLVRLFGEHTGDEIDKFAYCSWRQGPHGVPILEGASAWFVGTVLTRTELGDHIGHVLSPIAVSPNPDVTGYVTFCDVKGFSAGHGP
ncbi:MAG: flavin reductase family protein [Mycobacterium sp.]